VEEDKKENKDKIKEITMKKRVKIATEKLEVQGEGRN
jgi:hypothetical protein